MKAYWVTLSSLCVCTILLCFSAYKMDRSSMPNSTSAAVDSARFDFDQHPSVPATHPQIGMHATLVEDVSDCDSCIERLSIVFEAFQQE